ncbi:hypothetical protein CsatB_015079 [Cannabis sativa]
MTQKEMEKEAIKEASVEVSREFKTLIDSQHLDSLKQMQNLILGRLQDSNAVLSHFNEYSENCFAEVSGDFSRNTRVLKSMKTDLDYVFLKLRYVLIEHSPFYATLDLVDLLVIWIIHIPQLFLIRSMKSRILATYPDAFPNDSEREVLDRRPDLETPQ